MIYFITGNNKKFEMAKQVIPELEKIDIDLPEIQEMDQEEIIREKLLEATKHRDKEFVVEDTGLFLDGMNGLPGPLVKWFLKAVGYKGIYELCDKFDNYNATAKTIVGYIDSDKEIYFFEGEVKGTIVKPRREDGFGWSPVFVPRGHQKTFSEMDFTDDNYGGMRRDAFKKLRDFLNQKGD